MLRGTAAASASFPSCGTTDRGSAAGACCGNASAVLPNGTTIKKRRRISCGGFTSRAKAHHDRPNLTRAPTCSAPRPRPPPPSRYRRSRRLSHASRAACLSTRCRAPRRSRRASPPIPRSFPSRCLRRGIRLVARQNTLKILSRWNRARQQGAAGRVDAGSQATGAHGMCRVFEVPCTSAGIASVRSCGGTVATGNRVRRGLWKRNRVAPFARRVKPASPSPASSASHRDPSPTARSYCRRPTACRTA